MSKTEQIPWLEPIAIIGMQGRFPGARNIEEFWRNLQDGVESLKAFSEEEMKASGVDPSWMNLPGYVHSGSVLDDVEMFDAQFFGLSARDAEIIDPQQRLFLEIAWESLEIAGYDPDTFPGNIAVFGGSETSTYLYQLVRNPDRLTYADPAVLQIGNDKDYLTTQVSYKLNLKGPSVAVQTACSTSLVAVTLACQSLLSQQCDMALAGGVSVGVPQKKGYWYQPGGIFSPDGHCRPFDAAGQGTVVGNGVGIVVLKRLAEAIADGDQVHAVIKGAAINNDGAAKVGFSAPSVEGQVRAIRSAQKMAGVPAQTIGYVEAHGTATLLGDPIEFAALNEVFKEGSSQKGWCAIGSLKSNCGHLASAAGVSGLIKTVLSLRNKTIVPSLNFKTPNPQIDFANSPFYVNTELRPWERNGTPRRAGISSFGVGGTNAHVVVEEAPEPAPSGPSRTHQILLVSAKTASALDTATKNLAEHLLQHPDLNLADVAFVTQTGRKAFGQRRFLVSDGLDIADAGRALYACDPQRVMTGAPHSYDRPVVFMFSGQGAQYVNMCRDLYRFEIDFREHVDRCCDLLHRHLGFDLRSVLYPAPGEEDKATARLTHTSVTQPALFTIEYALAQLWMKWGVQPKAMIGHSIGEYVAGSIAGVFSLEDVLKLVAVRGRLMEEMPEGSMLAVPLAESEAKLLLDSSLSLAAVNAPYMSVLAGPTGEIDRVAVQLNERGLQARKLHTSHAFHSSMMDAVLDRFRDAVRSIDRSAPQIPYISNVTGTWITASAAQDPDYWSRHLRSTVRFAQGLEELLRAQDLLLLEIGPGGTLQTFARQQPTKGREHAILSSVRSVQEQQTDVAFLLNTLGQLWLNGSHIDWRAFSALEKRRRVPLPTYPFERQRYWIGVSESNPAPLLQHEAAKERDISDWFYVPSWKPAMPGSRSHTDLGKGRWLLFVDDIGVGAQIEAQLRAAGAEVAIVRPGRDFTRTDQHYEIRPDKQADYQALLKEICATGAPPNHIAHLWSVTPEFGDFDALQPLGFYSLLYLGQALEKQNLTSPVQIGFVANQLHPVFGGEPLCPPKATALGACKVLPQEFPNLRCRSIDIAVDRQNAVEEKIAERIIDELTTEPFEAVVAYRNGQRWIQSFELAKLDRPDRAVALREGGVYLITGGLGNIGLVAAESLARTAHAKLILTGRSAFPERQQWEQWLAAQGESDPISEKIRRLLRLEAHGAQVAVFSADASDYEQMKAVIDAAEECFGSVNGVIHGAGNTSADGFVPASQLDRRVAESQFQPKARGMIVLEELLRGKPIDFCFLLSSISGVLGGLGLLAYSAANLFLDAFAASQNQTSGVPWISANWDAWQFPADESVYKAAVPNWREYILPSEGAAAFQRILEHAPGHIVVSATNLEERLKKWVKLESLREMQAGSPQTGSLHPRPNLSTQYVAPRTRTEQTLASIWENLLGAAPIGVHDKFFELGGHSLLAIQLISKVRESFQVEVPPQRLFEAPTVAQFAASIEAALAAAKEQQEQQDEEHIAELLQLVEGLSDEEVTAMLENPDKIAKVQTSHG